MLVVTKPDPSSNLRNKLFFPTIKGCPSDDELDLRYYPDEGPEPAIHWCVLAQIMDVVVGSGRLPRGLRAQDVESNVTDIVFSIDDEASLGKCSKENRKFRIGHTIAILYPFAENRYFSRPSIIRVESVSSFMVIPCSLETLFTVNDKIHKSSNTLGCSEPDCYATEKLSACSRCHTARYCGREHQVKHWKLHKPECHAYQTLGWFTEKDWTDWEDWWDFP